MRAWPLSLQTQTDKRTDIQADSADSLTVAMAAFKPAPGTRVGPELRAMAARGASLPAAPSIRVCSWNSGRPKIRQTLELGPRPDT